jgi:medium-chain acyl-[acyl-carrier-protein] hydrolase
MFCFPYAGGGTAIFRHWYQSLPADIELVALRLPGRENRFNESPIGSLPILLEQLQHHIQPLLDKPYVFFGHSNGALVCFELARLLQRRLGIVPTGIILSAKCPPHLGRSTPNISQLSDAEFIAELHAIQGTPRALLQHQELMQLLLPMLRADFSLSENVRYQHDLLLDCPATLFYGLQDKIPLAQIMAWQDLLRRPVAARSFSGGHFFIEEQRQLMLLALSELLTEYLAAVNYSRPPVALHEL